MAYRRSLGALGVSAEVQAQARDLYDRGQQAFNAARYADALSLFQEAYRIFPLSTVLVAEATTLERLGRKEEARQQYQSYLWLTPDGALAARAREGVARNTPQQGSVIPDGASLPEASAPPPVLPTVEVDHTGVLVAAGVGVVAIAGLGWWLNRRRRPVATNRRRPRRAA